MAYAQTDGSSSSSTPPAQSSTTDSVRLGSCAAYHGGNSANCPNMGSDSGPSSSQNSFSGT